MNEKTINKNQGKINKTKGSNAERYYAKEFRDLGFNHCKTSRAGSRLHDDAGIDLIFLPFNVQIKAGKQTGLNSSKELSYITNKMKELFPQSSIEHVQPKILIHRKEVGVGKKRGEFDEIVSMTFVDFKKILKKIETW